MGGGGGRKKLYPLKGPGGGGGGRFYSVLRGEGRLEKRFKTAIFPFCSTSDHREVYDPIFKIGRIDLFLCHSLSI